MLLHRLIATLLVASVLMNAASPTEKWVSPGSQLSAPTCSYSDQALATVDVGAQRYAIIPQPRHFAVMLSLLAVLLTPATHAPAQSLSTPDEPVFHATGRAGRSLEDLGLEAVIPYHAQSETWDFTGRAAPDVVQIKMRINGKWLGVFKRKGMEFYIKGGDSMFDTNGIFLHHDYFQKHTSVDVIVTRRVPGSDRTIQKTVTVHIDQKVPKTWKLLGLQNARDQFEQLDGLVMGAESPAIARLEVTVDVAGRPVPQKNSIGYESGKSGNAGYRIPLNFGPGDNTIRLNATFKDGSVHEAVVHTFVDVLVRDETGIQFEIEGHARNAVPADYISAIAQRVAAFNNVLPDFWRVKRIRIPAFEPSAYSFRVGLNDHRDDPMCLPFAPFMNGGLDQVKNVAMHEAAHRLFEITNLAITSQWLDRVKLLPSKVQHVFSDESGTPKDKLGGSEFFAQASATLSNPNTMVFFDELDRLSAPEKEGSFQIARDILSTYESFGLGNLFPDSIRARFGLKTSIPHPPNLLGILIAPFERARRRPSGFLRSA